MRLAGTAGSEAALLRLGALPGVAAVLDTRSLESSITDAFGLYDVLVLLMGAIGAAMAAALLFNTASASLSERTVELGSLQAAGMGAGMLVRLVAVENLLLTVAALLPGLAAGWLLARAFMSAYQNGRMQLSLQLQPASMPMVALAVLLTAGAAQWLAVRRIGRTDIARIVRERSNVTARGGGATAIRTTARPPSAGTASGAVWSATRSPGTRSAAGAGARRHRG